jgi:hypothetical protein
MDVTRAARGAQQAAQKHAEAEPASTADAARVLAAIHRGTEVVPELAERTGLGDDAVLAALSLLRRTGLIELENQGGAYRARLTEPTRAALSSA